MPKRDAKYMAGRRNEIFDAAEICLEREGLESFTIESICREAGISTGALYRHFSTKRDILLGLLDRSISQRSDVKIESLLEFENFLLDLLDGYDAPGGGNIARVNLSLLQVSQADPQMLAKVQESVIGFDKFLGESLHFIASKDGLPSSTEINLAAKRIGSIIRGIWVAKAVDPQLSAKSYADCLMKEMDLLR